MRTLSKPPLLPNVLAAVLVPLLLTDAALAAAPYLQAVLSGQAAPRRTLLLPLLLVAVAASCSLACRLGGGKAAGRLEGDLRSRILNKVYAAGPVGAPSAGRITAITTGIVERVAGAKTKVLPELLAMLYSPFCVSVVWALWGMWRSALTLSATSGLAYVLVRLFLKKIRKSSVANRRAEARLSESYLQSLRALGAASYLNGQDFLTERVEESAEVQRQRTMSLLAVNQSVLFVIHMAAFAVAFTASALVLSVEAPYSGMAVAACASLVIALRPVDRAGLYFVSAMGGRGAQTALSGFEHPLKRSESAVYGQPNPHNIVDLVDVTAGYAQDKPVLRNFFLSVRKGEHVALVGATGAGKSTIAGVLEGFVPVLSGKVAIDGVDSSARYPAASCVAYVPQNPYLLGDTVRQCFGSRTETAIWQALEDAQIGSWLRANGGLDLPLIEGGKNLSGGQRARIAIAIALASDKELLLLDEPTASIDEQSQKLILKTLAEQTGKRTILHIAHRAEAIAAAQRVVRVEAR